jgi:hypothetical protein
MKRVGMAISPKRGKEGRQDEYGVYEGEYGGYSVKYEGYRQGDTRVGIPMRHPGGHLYEPSPIPFSSDMHGKHGLHRKDFARVHFFKVEDAKRYRAALREQRHKRPRHARSR